MPLELLHPTSPLEYLVAHALVVSLCPSTYLRQHFLSTKYQAWISRHEIGSMCAGGFTNIVRTPRSDISEEKYIDCECILDVQARVPLAATQLQLVPNRTVESVIK